MYIIYAFTIDITALYVLINKQILNLKKTEFNVKYPFKVIQGHEFWPNSESSEETVGGSTENCRFRQPHYRLTTLSREPPRMSPYCQKLDSLRYIIAVDSVGLSSFKIFVVGSENASILKQSA